jgi:hypothetical protein
VTRRINLAVLALLVPAVLSGCSLLGSSSEAIGGSGADRAGSADGPSWIVATQGSATPSPRPSRPSAPPTPPAASGFLPGPAATPARTPAPTCSPNTFSFSKIDGLEVTPGATSAVLSWYNVGGYNLVEFRLYAISQDLKRGKQRDVTFVTVKPKMPCGEMTGTIGNLDRRTHYVFSVDAVVTRRSGDGTHAATVARSHSIPTT